MAGFTTTSTHAVLQIGAGAYADIRRRLVAIDEIIGGDLNQYQRDFIWPGPPERIIFGEVALEAVAPEPRLSGLAERLDAARHRLPSNAVDSIADDLAWVAERLEHQWADWKPTPAEINALPDPIRAYIHDLSTICDPAGDVLEHHQLKQQAGAVEAMYLADQQDAARWRALLHAASSAQGSAGIDWGIKPGGREIDGTATPNPLDAGYMHAGINFHTQASELHFDEKSQPVRSLARAILTLIADQVIAQGGEAWAMRNGIRVVTPGSGDERDTAGDSPAALAGGELAGG